jgi:predicted transposase YbfD/YdcC
LGLCRENHWQGAGWGSPQRSAAGKGYIFAPVVQGDQEKIGGMIMLRESFLQHFASITDERQEGKVRYPLMSIFFVAAASYIAFCDDWDLTIIWAEKNIDWLRQFVDLPYGIPSESTFYRVFRAVNPKEFERRFIGWTKQLSLEHGRRSVAVDGKTLRGAKETPGETSPFHIVSAWASDNNLTLGFSRTKEKSNEITAIPELLKLLSIEGDIVTIDAMGAQTEIAKQIVEGNKADYILNLKRNQPSMYKDTALFFTGVDLEAVEAQQTKAKDAGLKAEGADGAAASETGGDATVGAPNDDLKAAAERIYAQFSGRHAQALPPQGSNYELPVFADYNYQFLKTADIGHGRIENRLYFLVPDVSWLSRHDEWAGLKSVGMVISHTVIKKTGHKSIDCRFYISSIDDVSMFAKSVRNHWGCESTHYVLDVTFSEDKSRTHKENGALNEAMFRRIALNLLKVERERGTPGRKRLPTYRSLRFHASLDISFLEKVMISNLK